MELYDSSGEKMDTIADTGQSWTKDVRVFSFRETHCCQFSPHLT